MEAFAYAALLGSAFAGAFSLPLGRGFLALSLAGVLAHAVRSGRVPAMPRTARLAAVFIAVAVVATIFGVDPALGLPRLRKLVWFLGIPVAASLVGPGARLRGLLAAYAAGTGALSAWTCAARPLRALAHVRAGEFPSLASAVVDAGSMTDGQRLMLGILVSVGFLFVCRSEKRSALGWALLLLLQTAALILNFKRGSWLCAAALVAVFMASETKWRYLLVLAAVAVAALAVPPVRARLVSLREEVDRPGGRVTMWTKIAPALIRQHPWGIGWRSLTNERMRSIAPEVEADRNHLHSNPVQVLVETGWLGLAVYVLWMASAVADAAACVRRGRGRPRAEAVLGRVLLLMLAGLLLNGLVEYNLADGEIVLLYSLVMGAAAAGDARNESRPIGLFWPRKRRSN